MLFRNASCRCRRKQRLSSNASSSRPFSRLVRLGRLYARNISLMLTNAQPVSPHVFVTDSFDPFLNLAFEDAILERRRVENAQGMQLLIWRNGKSVILGRNQNPWVECNIPFLSRHNIPIVRRSSGGGTVFHDLGNTNITIFAQDHLPERNLKFVISALAKSFSLDAYISPRKDIFVDQKKVLHFVHQGLATSF
jgi:lipoate-protein ligase A